MVRQALKQELRFSKIRGELSVRNDACLETDTTRRTWERDHIADVVKASNIVK